MKSKTEPMQMDTLKNQTCSVCKCASGGKCYHFAFMGKSGKPLSCQVAVMNCPGYMEKSNGCDSEY